MVEVSSRGALDYDAAFKHTKGAVDLPGLGAAAFYSPDNTMVTIRRADGSTVQVQAVLTGRLSGDGATNLRSALIRVGKVAATTE